MVGGKMQGSFDLFASADELDVVYLGMMSSVPNFTLSGKPPWLSVFSPLVVNDLKMPLLVASGTLLLLARGRRFMAFDAQELEIWRALSLLNNNPIP